MSRDEYLQQVSDGETAEILQRLSDVVSAKVSGDVVEFGCYRGDTSLLLQRLLTRDFVDSAKSLWLYDSFEGLPPKTAEDSSAAGDAFSTGKLLVSKREVVERFKRAGLRVPRIRKGFFENLDPASDLPESICFAFLDGDLYSSIKTSLQLVAPRMIKGGIIIVHDYNNPQLPGSARAVDEWLVTHPKYRLERKETLAIIRQ